MNENENERTGIGYWISVALMIVLAVGILLFLGKHSLNYFMTTFAEDDQIYAYLGLTFTSIGVLGWTSILLWMARTNLQRATALVMILCCALGELLVAGFDMILQRTGLQFTEQDIETQVWIVAGFGFLQGIAMMVFHVGDFISNLQWRTVKGSVVATNTRVVASHPLVISPSGNSVVNQDGGSGFTD